jgi:hypothetical protein
VKTKALEIRDEGTFIPALAVLMNPDDAGVDPAAVYLLRRCGYAFNTTANVLLTRLDGSGKATNDPYEWGGRTWPVAHNYIIDHWEELSDGDVVDVSFILGETDKPKLSERFRGDPHQGWEAP